MRTGRHDKVNSCNSQIFDTTFNPHPANVENMVSNNASKLEKEINSAFKGLKYVCQCLSVLLGRDSDLQTRVTSEAVSPASFCGRDTEERGCRSIMKICVDARLLQVNLI